MPIFYPVNKNILYRYDLYAIYILMCCNLFDKKTQNKNKHFTKNYCIFKKHML